MKKIGIMSMQRIVNYGSFLQAYGLKKIVNEIGYGNVQYVDYTYEKTLCVENENRIKCFKNRTIKKRFLGKIFTIACAQKLKKDLKVIGIDKPNYRPEIDTLIIGSDEVFNCIQGYPVGYSKELFGKNYENKNVISYAASFGYTTEKDLEKYGIKSEVAEMLSKFSALSVRDDNSYLLINKLIGKEAQIHLDPVLIYDFRQEMNRKIKCCEEYIVVYAYTNRLSADEEEYIKKFAIRHKKKIYSIGNYSGIADKNIICSPLEVFSYFKGADYIITDTFHGTIFSIKTNSKFCTIIRETNANKLVALLQKLGREDRIVNLLEDIELLYKKEIDYRVTNDIINQEKEKTIQYLRKHI